MFQDTPPPHPPYEFTYISSQIELFICYSICPLRVFFDIPCTSASLLVLSLLVL